MLDRTKIIDASRLTTFAPKVRVTDQARSRALAAARKRDERRREALGMERFEIETHRDRLIEALLISERAAICLRSLAVLPSMRRSSLPILVPTLVAKWLSVRVVAILGGLGGVAGLQVWSTEPRHRSFHTGWTQNGHGELL